MTWAKMAPGNCCCVTELPPVGSSCCLTGGAGWGPNGVALIPGAAVDPAYDEADCAALYFPFGDMIVEVSGIDAAYPAACWSGVIDGSYVVPNQADTGIHSSVRHNRDQGCQWQKLFTISAPGCPALPAFTVGISVATTVLGALRGTVSVYANNAGPGAMAVGQYLLGSTSPNAFDFTAGPLAIPPDSGFGSLPDLIVSL